MSYLEWKQVSAGYGKAQVLHRVDISVGAGEALAVVGRNGAGKSTLMESLFGIPRIFSGSITIDGSDLNPKKAFMASQRGVSIAPQGKRIISSLTVEDNLLLGAASRRGGDWSLGSVYELFPILKDRSKAPSTALSGGQQQMLAIGRALMANPQVLLLDEPSEGLAPVVIDQIVDALRAVHSTGTGMVIVEQHLGLVRRIAEHFVVLVKGEVAARGPISEIDAPELRGALAL